MWQWKKNSWVRVTSWYHCQAEDSRIPKIPAIKHPYALVHLQTQKTILHRLSIPNLNLSEFVIFGICRLGIVDFTLPSNCWVSQLHKSEFAVLGFEKLGLELDNCGRTTNNAYCRIYSLCFQYWVLTDAGAAPPGQRAVATGLVRGLRGVGKADRLDLGAELDGAAGGGVHGRLELDQGHVVVVPDALVLLLVRVHLLHVELLLFRVVSLQRIRTNRNDYTVYVSVIMKKLVEVDQKRITPRSSIIGQCP